MDGRRMTRLTARALLSQQHNNINDLFAQVNEVSNQEEATGSARTNGIEGEVLETGPTFQTRRDNNLQNISASQPITVGGASLTGDHDVTDSVIFEEIIYGPNIGVTNDNTEDVIISEDEDAMDISSGSGADQDNGGDDDYYGAGDDDYYGGDDDDYGNDNVHEHPASPPIIHTLLRSSPTREETQPPLVAQETIVLPEIQSSQADFQSPNKKVSVIKKKGSEEKRKLDDTVDEAELCTICFEQWTTSGRHRLVCLKCGHLYGQECIEKWLDTQKGTCPQCNAKASRKDIRCLYVKKLVAMDTSEVERLKKELEEERTTRKRAEHDLGLMRLRWEQTEGLCTSLRRDLAAQRELTSATARQVVMDSSNQGVNTTSGGRYDIEKSFAIDVGGCRVLAHNNAKSYLCASQSSPSPLYPGCGVRKLSTLDLKTYQYVPMHSKQIRDLAFHPTLDRSLLLSCAMDKMVKVTSMESLETVQSFQCQNPVWACTWNTDNLNHFFVGTQMGEVLLFDIRDTRDHVASLLPHNPKSVVSLRYKPRSMGDSPGPGGLLIGQLDRSLFLENNNKNNNFSTHYLSNDSVLMSLSLEENTGHVLVSYRPTQQAPTVRHEVNNFVMTAKPLSSSSSSSSSSTSFYERVAYDKVRTFNGGSSQQTLTRTTIFPHPALGSEQLFVCAGDGNHPMVNLWNVSTGLLHQRLVGPDQGVSDICPISGKDGMPTLLSAVGNRHLFIYKWTETSS